MNILILSIYIVLGLLLLIINTYLIKQYNITKIKSILISLLYIIILSGIFSNYLVFTNNIFLVYVFTFILDIIYVTYIISDDFFSKEKFSYYLILIVSGYLLNMYFINKVDTVFLNSEQIKIIIWIFIILYLYKLINKSKILNSNFKNNTIHNENIELNYVKYRNKYKLMYEDKDLELIIYSIMINNNKIRNTLLRKIDNLLVNINYKKRPLSIMLIDSNRYLDDKEGISIAYNRLTDIKKKSKGYKSIIKKYDDEHSEDIIRIYESIKEFLN